MVDPLTLALIAALFFLVALVYSSVGHAGASGYLAVMALFGVAPETMRPTALALNVLVATIATVRFARAGHFSFARFWPFAAGSIPFAFLGGSLLVSSTVYRRLLGFVLLFSALRILTVALSRASAPMQARRRPPTPAALSCGAGIGLLSGLTGTGGGIFLSPLLLFFRWADTKTTSAVSAAFILVNSLSGLAGNLASVRYLPEEVALLALVVGLGGWIGSTLGSTRFSPRMLQLLLGGVLIVAGAKLVLAL